MLLLADDSFQIHFHDLLKQQPSITFDVIEIENRLKIKNPAYNRNDGREDHFIRTINQTN